MKNRTWTRREEWAWVDESGPSVYPVRVVITHYGRSDYDASIFLGGNFITSGRGPDHEYALQNMLKAMDESNALTTAQRAIVGMAVDTWNMDLG